MAAQADKTNLKDLAATSKSLPTKKSPVGAKSKANISYAPMLVLLLFSFLLLTLPLGTYFFIRHHLGLSTTFAAMGAIVSVQLIVAAYIYKAWHDESEEHEKQLRDKEKLKKRN